MFAHVLFLKIHVYKIWCADIPRFLSKKITWTPNHSKKKPMFWCSAKFWVLDWTLRHGEHQGENWALEISFGLLAVKPFHSLVFVFPLSASLIYHDSSCSKAKEREILEFLPLFSPCDESDFSRAHPAIVLNKTGMKFETRLSSKRVNGSNMM